MSPLTHITLRVLDGPDKGTDFIDVELPLSIGREKENRITLNDDRVSRYHCKIQADHNEIIVIDAESTNGTRLNGQPVWLGALWPGDVLMVGQSMIVVGTREEILKRLESLSKINMREAGLRFMAGDNTTPAAKMDLPTSLQAEFAKYPGNAAENMLRAHALFPPELPQGLTSEQKVRLAELLLYIQLRLRLMIDSAEQQMHGKIVWNPGNWQCLIDLFSRVTDYWTGLEHCDLGKK